ncbi:MAG: hypothetical protein ABA06_00890 [Parcubacteria bacterium C7867-001]|nr:MAG: hypothetical protein ABA06_00890 [Parcubacteria bacterium C7867-001]
MESDPFTEFLTKVAAAIIDPLITLIALAAFVVFVWGVVDYVRGAGDAEKRKAGQQHMIWGIIGLAVLFGARAIVQILIATLNQTLGG